jgi:hypothetical protein
MRYLVHSDRRLNIRAMAVKLNLDKQLRALKKPRTFAHPLDSPSWQCSSSQSALCQEVSGTEIDYWNGTPTLFPRFGSKWLLFPKREVYLKGTKISGYRKHPKKIWTLFQKCFQQWHCNRIIDDALLLYRSEWTLR